MFTRTLQSMMILVAVFGFGLQAANAQVQNSGVQAEAKRFRERFTKMMQETKARMREQDKQVKALEAKRRSSGEQNRLLHLFEDRRRIVFHYYETKLAALKTFKQKYPRAAKSIDEAITKTNSNWWRDANKINQRQAAAVKQFGQKPTPSTKPRPPAPRKSTARSNPNQAKINRLRKQIRDLEFKISSMDRKYRDQLVVKRRAEAALNAAPAHQKRKLKSDFNRAKTEAWDLKVKIFPERKKLERLQRSLKTLGG